MPLETALPLNQAACIHTIELMNAARHLTIRNVPDEVAVALEAERRSRGTSLNQTVIELLRGSLGVGAKRDNGLGRFAGTWTQQDLEEFQRNTAFFDEIDPEMWK